MTTANPTPITDDTSDDQEPATTEPKPIEEVYAELDVIVAALADLGRELKAEMAAKEAA